MPPKDDDSIKIVNKEGETIAQDTEPLFLGTKPIKLPKPPKMGKGRTTVAVNLLFPPGVSKFFIERVDNTHIRFLVLTEELNRLSDKAEQIMKATEEAKNG